MPKCCVPDCKNSSAKGFILKCFPKNDKRRAQWVKNINRSNWIPNHSHRVCETHFAPEMWEKTRVDGSRKLKFNAVPTIFGDRMVKESPVIQVMISSGDKVIENNATNDASLKNVILSNNQRLIKILPPSNSLNPKPNPILISASTLLRAQSINPTSAIIVNQQGKILNSTTSPSISGATSILKPQIKIANVQSSPTIISTNTNVLKNQLKVSNSEIPIIIPATTRMLKSQAQTTNAQLNSIDFSDSMQIKAVNTQPVLMPVPTNALKPAVTFNQTTTDSHLTSTVVTNTNVLSNEFAITNPETPSPIICDTQETQNSNEQPTISTANSTGIILNKSQAKKLEAERFEKMDKLLLKQLKLNNALRKKLNLMNYKIQQLMKEQSNNYKEFLNDVFTEDQIRALELRHTNPRSITAWSHKTMLKAIKLKQECGTRGYEELLNQNMPLPSIRTISRWCTLRNIPIP